MHWKDKKIICKKELYFLRFFHFSFYKKKVYKQKSEKSVNFFLALSIGRNIITII